MYIYPLCFRKLLIIHIPNYTMSRKFMLAANLHSLATQTNKPIKCHLHVTQCKGRENEWSRVRIVAKTFNIKKKRRQRRRRWRKRMNKHWKKNHLVRIFSRFHAIYHVIMHNYISLLSDILFLLLLLLHFFFLLRACTQSHCVVRFHRNSVIVHWFYAKRENRKRNKTGFHAMKTKFVLIFSFLFFL